MDAPATVTSLLDFALETRRRRSPVEAALEKTARYLRLEAAWALNRLGEKRKAEALAVAPLRELRAGDPVERALEHCYRVRLIEARDRRAPDVWPEELGPSWKLDQFPAYRARRLAETYVLSPYLKPPPPKAKEDPAPGRAGWGPRRVADADVSWQFVDYKFAGSMTSIFDEAGPEIVAYAQQDYESALQVVDKVMARWLDVTDSFNTNDYYCLSVIRLFDLAVFGIVQALQPVDLRLKT